MPRLKAGRFCWVHEPDKGAEADEARRLGGMRRRREKALALAYDVAGLGSIAEARRVLDLTLLDTLALENSPSRNRLLAGLVELALRLVEAEREEALAASLMPDEDEG